MVAGLMPDSVVRELVVPRLARIVAELGGAPEGKRVAKPVIRICFSVGSSVEFATVSAQTIQSLPDGLLIRNATGVFLRTASKRVNFNMSDNRAAVSLS